MQHQEYIFSDEKRAEITKATKNIKPGDSICSFKQYLSPRILNVLERLDLTNIKELLDMYEANGAYGFASVKSLGKKLVLELGEFLDIVKQNMISAKPATKSTDKKLNNTPLSDKKLNDGHLTTHTIGYLKDAGIITLGDLLSFYTQHGKQGFLQIEYIDLARMDEIVKFIEDIKKKDFKAGKVKTLAKDAELTTSAVTRKSKKQNKK